MLKVDESLSFVIHDVLRQEHRQKTARWMQGLWAQAQPASLHARINVPLNLRDRMCCCRNTLARYCFQLVKCASLRLLAVSQGGVLLAWSRRLHWEEWP